MARTHLAKRIEFLIQEEITRRSGEILMGWLDRDHYKQQCGVLEGLNVALKLLEEAEGEQE